MKHWILGVVCFSASWIGVSAEPGELQKITQYGITWRFDKPYSTGRFVTGDYWVVGPVKIIGITTDLHAPGFSPEPGQDGSMANPGTTDKQGYDNRIKGSYAPALNAGLIDGKPVSPESPLVLAPDSSLVSMVSWLFKSEADTEPGTPHFAGYSHAPRSATRSAAVLTILKGPAPEGSFRPPYCGKDKTVKYNLKQLDLSKLKNLPPPPKTPDPNEIAKSMERPWIDHVTQWLGADIHPTENMPNYGREISAILSQAGLLMNLDFSRLPGQPNKEKLLINMVQFGIDLTGISDASGGWPADGGHGAGRKLPILIAGLALNDPHMKDVGHWKTRFQDNEQTFYVTQADVDLSHSPRWKPDQRAKDKEPYEAKDIGMPEWGIRHALEPERDNRGWDTPYRSVNYPGIVAVALAVLIMEQKDAWNHDAFLDYADRVMQRGSDAGQGANSVSPFCRDMWAAYRDKYPHGKWPGSGR
ncbi:MAG TPA: hypothetical protein VGP72_20625 [Planctomycetota bacterium]|jgi:hypothetical protein